MALMLPIARWVHAGRAGVTGLTNFYPDRRFRLFAALRTVYRHEDAFPRTRPKLQSWCGSSALLPSLRGLPVLGGLCARQ